MQYVMTHLQFHKHQFVGLAGQLDLRHGRAKVGVNTAAGLNSGLPGDRDVLEQLQTARRVAQRAETAGRLTNQLIDDAIGLERDVRGQA